MEVGLSSASFYPDLNTEDTIKTMTNIGFRSGEIFLNCLSEYEAEFIEQLLVEKERTGFQIKSVHAFSGSFEPYLFERYKRRRVDTLKIFKKVCNAAKALGANCYNFHGMRHENMMQIDLEFISDIYDELIYTAGESGIKLAQENVSWCMSSNLSFLEELKERCKYPLYFTLDIKQSYKAGINPKEYISVMGSRLTNLHVNDKDAEHLCMLPGRGHVDYVELKQNLEKIGYDGMAIIEVYRNNFEAYAELFEAKQFLEGILC